MQNLFYVPPHQPRDQHPKPLGVKTVVKRNQPTRLDLSTSAHGVARFDLSGDVDPTLRTTRTRGLLATLRKHIGAALIRMGQALLPDETTYQGQSV